MNFGARPLHSTGMVKDAKRPIPVENFAKWRGHLGLTQEQLADRLGISQPQVSRYESGTDQMTLPVLHAWAEAPGIEPGQFWSPPDAPKDELAEAMALAAKADAARQRDVARVVRAMLAA